MPDPKPAPILLLTRPMAAAQRFAGQLGGQVQTLFSPLIQIELIKIAPPTDDIRGIILTSENGALAAGRIAGLPRVAWCVGDRTAEAAREAGFDPISADGDAQTLIDLILSQAAHGPLLHLHGTHVRGDVVGRLNAAGVIARAIPAYRQTSLPLTPAALSALAGTRPVILPLFSPRTVTLLAESRPFGAPLHLVSISPAVANAALILNPASHTLAETPDATAMVRAVRASLNRITVQ